MGLFDKIFGKKHAQSEPDKQADSRKPTPTALQVVFSQPRSYTAASFEAAVRAIGPQLATASIETMSGTFENGTPVVRVSWASHIVEVVGLDAPMPQQAVEQCVASAYYAQNIKAIIRAQTAHALLFYGGDEPNVLEQYVALAAVAAAFGKLGAAGVLNESAMTSLPADMISELAESEPTSLQELRAIPLLMLYCGFIKYFMSDNHRVWHRTYNCPRFGLPDLAMLRIGTNRSQATFELFSGVLRYLQSSGKRLASGHTAQFGEFALRFRAPRDDEPFPTHTDGIMLVVEMTNAPA